MLAASRTRPSSVPGVEGVGYTRHRPSEHRDDLNRDFSESVDVREPHPDKLRELVAAFDDAAWTNLVYPLDNRTMVQKMSDGAAREGGAAPAARAFSPGTQTVHRAVVVPLISDRSYTVRAAFVWGDIDQGVVWAIGEQIGGVVLYVEDGRLRLCYNGYGEFSELPPVALAAGEVEATLEYEALGTARAAGASFSTALRRLRGRLCRPP